LPDEPGNLLASASTIVVQLLVEGQRGEPESVKSRLVSHIYPTALQVEDGGTYCLDWIQIPDRKITFGMHNGATTRGIQRF